MGFYAQIFVRTSLFFAARFILRQRVRFSTQNQGFQCSLFLCELNFKRQLIKAQGYILKTYIRTSVFFAGRFTLSQSSPPVRNATYLRTFFEQFIFVSREILSTSMFLFFFFCCCSIYVETAQNSRVECNEFADLLFFRLSLCLSRDYLFCDTRSLDLCILFKFIFLYL